MSRENMSENTVVRAGINNKINNEGIAAPVSMELSMSDVIRIMLTHQVVFERELYGIVDKPEILEYTY